MCTNCSLIKSFTSPDRRRRQPSALRLLTNRRTTILRSMVAALLSIALPNTAAYGQMTVENGCMEDIYDEFGQGGGLNCTANDISIANVTNITITDNGCAFAGDMVTFDATFEVLLTAQDRHDIGLYLSLDGGDALTGSCFISTLPFEPNIEFCTAAGVPFPCCTGSGTGTCDFVDIDGTTDNTTASNAFGYCSDDGGATWPDQEHDDRCHRKINQLSPLVPDRLLGVVDQHTTSEECPSQFM